MPEPEADQPGAGPPTRSIRARFGVLFGMAVFCNIVIFLGVARCNSTFGDVAAGRSTGEDLLPRDMPVVGVSTGACDALGFDGCYTIFSIAANPAAVGEDAERICDRLRRRGWRPVSVQSNPDGTYGHFEKAGSGAIYVRFPSERRAAACAAEGTACWATVQVAPE